MLAVHQHHGCFSAFRDKRRSQEFDFGGYKWVKVTKQPRKKFKVDWFGGIYTDIPPVATPLFVTDRDRKF